MDSPTTGLCNGGISRGCACLDDQFKLLGGLKLLETPVDNYRKLQCENTNHYLINIRKIKINEIFFKKVC